MDSSCPIYCISSAPYSLAPRTTTHEKETVIEGKGRKGLTTHGSKLTKHNPPHARPYTRIDNLLLLHQRCSREAHNYSINTSKGLMQEVRGVVGAVDYFYGGR